MKFRFLVCMLSAASLINLGQLGAQTQAKKPAYGTITKLASVPATPGFPEGVAVDGNRVFVSGPARFGTAGTGPSAIQVYDRNSGVLKQAISVVGESLDQEHAVSNIAVDGSGSIYALSTQLGLIRFSKSGGGYVQHAYGAPVPDLPPVVGPDLPPIVNDLVFDECGYAYVTDSLQATIFRYPPGGGIPAVWFQSPLLAGGGPIPFGPNGIRLDTTGQHVYFVSSTSAANPALGTIYRLPKANTPQSSDLQVFYQYAAGELPDQIAFGAQGTLYVSLALSNQISILSLNGIELGRISSQPSDATLLDNPAALAFDSHSKSLLVANHALLSGNPASFAVLSIYVSDPGASLFKP